jgi:hypothetical protein
MVVGGEASVMSTMKGTFKNTLQSMKEDIDRKKLSNA